MRTFIVLLLAMLLIAPPSFANVKKEEAPAQCPSRLGCAAMLIVDGVAIAASTLLTIAGWGYRLSLSNRVGFFRETGSTARTKEFRDIFLFFAAVTQGCVLISGAVTVPACLAH